MQNHFPYGFFSNQINLRETLKSASNNFENSANVGYSNSRIVIGLKIRYFSIPNFVGFLR